ncbi:hypothetical protein HY949_00375 [Candidatus Gottesmanbacteria bacterium]|nr:hypothetical protein [Candidatus Gottesmanbacteria bacterium]
MIHPGELDRRHHPNGIHNGTEAVFVKRFPLSEKEVRIIQQGGGTVDQIYNRQTVVFSNGVEITHGVDDGLHEESVVL